MKKMTERVKKFELLMDAEAKELLDELKKESTTYGEIIVALDVTYGGASYNSVIAKARTLIKKEISEIPFKESH